MKVNVNGEPDDALCRITSPNSSFEPPSSSICNL
jgi:hypothetical protein